MRLIFICCCSLEGRGVISFFFSSRRRHTRLQGDWSSDVCSSDLYCLPAWQGLGAAAAPLAPTRARSSTRSHSSQACSPPLRRAPPEGPIVRLDSPTPTGPHAEYQDIADTGKVAPHEHLDVHFVCPAPVLSPWERRAPARLRSHAGARRSQKNPGELAVD